MGRGGARKRENVSPDTPLVRVPSFISITAVGGRSKARTDLETMRCASD